MTNNDKHNDKQRQTTTNNDKQRETTTNNDKQRQTTRNNDKQRRTTTNNEKQQPTANNHNNNNNHNDDDVNDDEDDDDDDHNNTFKMICSKPKTLHVCQTRQLQGGPEKPQVRRGTLSFLGIGGGRLDVEDVEGLCKGFDVESAATCATSVWVDWQVRTAAPMSPLK